MSKFPDSIHRLKLIALISNSGKLLLHHPNAPFKSPVLYQRQHQAYTIADKDKAPHGKGIFNLYFL